MTCMKISLLTRLLDIIAPRTCIVCGSRLSVTEDVICQKCCLHLPRTGFATSATDNLMARLFWGQMPAERAAALFYYQPRSETARIVYDMKYAGRADAAVAMGRLIATELIGTGFFEGIDIMVPVPLTRSRKRRRGYNQSELLAQGISEVTGIPVDAKAVERTDFTASQTSIMRWMRRDNVKGAFRPVGTARLHGRHVLIVDDVITSGATTMACGGCMNTAGDIRLSIVTLAFTKS